MHISRVVWASVFMCHEAAWKTNKMKSNPTKGQSLQDCRLKEWMCTCQISNGWKHKWALQCPGDSLRFLAVFLLCYAWVWFSLVCAHFSSLSPFTPALFCLPMFLLPFKNSRNFEENCLICGTFILNGLSYAILVTSHSRLSQYQEYCTYSSAIDSFFHLFLHISWTQGGKAQNCVMILCGSGSPPRDMQKQINRNLLAEESENYSWDDFSISPSRYNLN